MRPLTLASSSGVWGSVPYNFLQHYFGRNALKGGASFSVSGSALFVSCHYSIFALYLFLPPPELSSYPDQAAHNRTLTILRLEINSQTPLATV
jgi:hypothetical protein